MEKTPIYVPDNIKQSRGWSVLHPLHEAIDIARTRMVVVAAVFVIAFSVIGYRLLDICILRGGDESLLVEHNLASSPNQMRADIVDRNGELLATSLRTSSLYANARVVIDPMKSAEKLVTVLNGLDAKDVAIKLSSGKGFIWLARHLTPTKQAEVIRLGIPGLYFQKDERRIYPHGSLFSHMLGFTDIDSKGISGIERKFNSTLRTENSPLVLSVDLRVQHILWDELQKGIAKFKAQGGAGLIMDVKTGEIVAMASLPDFDPHRIGTYRDEPQALFNRTTLGIYEMGSSFKLLNVAMALDSGTAKLYDEFDVTKPLKIGRFRITDYPRQSDHWMNVAEIFVKSSNIGCAKLALQAGADLQQAFMEKLGLFEAASLELPEMGSPLLPKQWSKATTITASYGYGISVSAIQLIRAVSGILNKGIMVQPTLVKIPNGESVEGVRVVSEETSDVMRKLLYQVVDEGTGRKARVNGYEVGGKTGTANQANNGSYKKGQNTTSFMAAFPMRDPQYAVFIMVDRPQGIEETYGYNAGGWNAAPIAGHVIRKAAPLLGVVPVRQVKKTETDPMMLNVSVQR